ncbi:MAG: reprolysin-like metallopeptidase [Psychroflexus halocasei]
MQLKLPLLLVMILMINFTSAQESYWSQIDENKLEQDEILETFYEVKSKSTYHLNFDVIKSELTNAPFRFEATESQVQIEIPNENGDINTYKIFKVRTMSDELSEKFPEINSYIGKSHKENTHQLRMTVTPQGLYVMVLRPEEGALIINPVTRDGQFYSVFNKRYTDETDAFNYCENTEEVDFNSNLTTDDYETLDVDDSTLRTYDLALATTGEYSQFQINQAGLNNAPQSDQITAVLAAMTVTIDRVNMLYERDVAVNLQLIANTDDLIYLNPNTDPYTNDNGVALLGQNQQNVDSTIGSNNYHIGHVFSTGGGGIAALGSVCVNNSKARGVTGSEAPVGDPFDIDYVSHEIGHQFGAKHTYNNYCNGQRSNDSSVEPGSGNTIMGYAGICPPNTRSNSDDHFHQLSIFQIYNNITNGSGASCPTLNTIPNTAPSITASSSFVIPNGTAFYLDAEATDVENDALTYNWEQYDVEISNQPPLPTNIQGPNFISNSSLTESRRYFPKFEDVLNNNLTPTWEVVPSTQRNMDFTLTVRDNNINGGQTARKDVSVSFRGVGPFEVTSQNEADINWIPGETETITWNVAGTTGNGINTSNVNILLSTDNGENFDTILASNVPNNGSYDIVVPNEQAAFCRIMIEPVDNVYYALNQKTFAIDTNIQTNCETYTNNTAVDIPDGIGPNQQGPTASSTINVTQDMSVDDININVDVTHPDAGDLVVQLEAPNGEIILLWGRNCADGSFNITFNDNGSTLPGQGYSCNSPVTGTYTAYDGLLSDLTTGSVQGNWTLAIGDFYDTVTGTLNSWSIEMCTTTLGLDDQSLSDFSIYPNPTNGEFSLNFSKALNKNAIAKIYSLQGQVIEEINLSSQSTSHQIKLTNALQSGVYLIEVNDGQSKSVEKLIVR